MDIMKKANTNLLSGLNKGLGKTEVRHSILGMNKEVTSRLSKAPTSTLAGLDNATKVVNKLAGTTSLINPQSRTSRIIGDRLVGGKVISYLY
ncbi:hypothetical protein AYR59_04495 [Fructilactobacillus lindneri]|uniref:Uncharacterized protein n=1 Tax=Fructilactobacillus lindneri TaxID=53444 RepID=A0AB33BMV2_9LACO|nr:hypothetical protein [Fructilactobacillus lindneri]ANZ59312.1 hypothetical protein AYR59_04495 [Fructilactobacillus lindneri]